MWYKCGVKSLWQIIAMIGSKCTWCLDDSGDVDERVQTLSDALRALPHTCKVELDALITSNPP